MITSLGHAREREAYVIMGRGWTPRNRAFHGPQLLPAMRSHAMMSRLARATQVLPETLETPPWSCAHKAIDKLKLCISFATAAMTKSRRARWR